MSLDRIDRRSSSLSGTIYLKLRDAIVHGEFLPGTPLIEDQLASMLGVSRAPLREALVRLDHEGLIQTTPYRERVVANITQAEVMQMMQVREPMELLSVQLAIDRIPAAEIDAAIQLVNDRRIRLEQGDLTAHFECNRAVHGLAPRYSGNAYLEEFVRVLEEKAHVYRMRTHAIEEISAMASEHLDILRALSRRDEALVVELLRNHFRLTIERLGVLGHCPPASSDMDKDG